MAGFQAGGCPRLETLSVPIRFFAPDGEDGDDGELEYDEEETEQNLEAIPMLLKPVLPQGCVWNDLVAVGCCMGVWKCELVSYGRYCRMSCSLRILEESGTSRLPWL